MTADPKLHIAVLLTMQSQLRDIIVSTTNGSRNAHSTEQGRLQKALRDMTAQAEALAFALVELQEKYGVSDFKPECHEYRRSNGDAS
jgi:hypothetical protein